MLEACPYGEAQSCIVATTGPTPKGGRVSIEAEVVIAKPLERNFWQDIHYSIAVRNCLAMCEIKGSPKNRYFKVMMMMMSSDLGSCITDLAATDMTSFPGRQ